MSGGRWPSPLSSRHAFYGLAGEFVKSVQTSTEADPAGLLVQFLVLAGSMMGRRAGIYQAGMHYPNLYTVLVGGSGGLGRKGTSYGVVKDFFRQVDEVFMKERVTGGLSSGEGLLMEVRDPITKLNDKGEVVLIDPGVTDKRVCWIEPEFANVIDVKGRDGNTLSSHLRNAWDGWDVLKVATKNSPLRSTAPHVSLIAMITPHELNSRMSEGDAFNGFANRCLFVCVKASQRLPFGGSRIPLPVLADRLRQSLAFCDHLQEVAWDANARPLWEELYKQVQPVEDGILAALMGRADAQLLRLCLIYALLDQSPVIRPNHVLAAAAIWNYSKDTLEYLFGGESSMVGPFNELVYDMISEHPGIKLYHLDQRMGYPTRTTLAAALQDLEREGLIARVREAAGPKGGRPVERFYPQSRNPETPKPNSVSGEVSGEGSVSRKPADLVSGNTPNTFPGFPGDYRELIREELFKAVDEVLEKENG